MHTHTHTQVSGDTFWYPLGLVICFTVLKDAYEDYQVNPLYYQDNQVNRLSYGDCHVDRLSYQDYQAASLSSKTPMKTIRSTFFFFCISLNPRVE